MSRIVLGWGMLTILALGVVQQRVSLIRMGYEVERLRNGKEELLDQHRVLQYNVLTLQSPVILSHRLAKGRVELAPAAHVEVLSRSLEAVTSVPAEPLGVSPNPTLWLKAKRLLASWAGTGQQAEAQPIPGGQELSAGR